MRAADIVHYRRCAVPSRVHREAHGDRVRCRDLDLWALTACLLHTRPDMTTTSENRIIARRYLSELWSRGILETADELVAAHCELNDPLCGAGIGPEALKAAVRELRIPFPDLAFSVDSFIVEAGDQLALRWFAHGTHRAPFLAIPATERAFLVSGLLLLRFDAGKLIAITACWEPTLLLEQLGLLDPSFDPAPCEPMPVPEPLLPPPPPERHESMRFAPAEPESELDAGWT